MSNNLPTEPKEQQPSQKPLIFFLIFLCLVFVSFLAYVFLWPNSILRKTQMLKDIKNGQYCEQLLKRMESSIGKTDPKKFDFNSDGKIDKDDLFKAFDKILALGKIESEKWCQKILK